jgi:hypothetical protein
MGDRAMAEIKTEKGSIYFYTHWSGHELPNIAKTALETASPRKGDFPYATKIVIDSLIKGTGVRDSETGGGIMLGPDAEDEYNNDSPSVVIDLHAWKVSSNRKS